MIGKIHTTNRNLKDLKAFHDISLEYAQSSSSYIRTCKDPSAIRILLIDWYHLNRRKMPWRGDVIISKNGESIDIPITPYGIWISEVMLQQTRVETVIDYWFQWMKTFPDVNSLSKASPDDVNKLWAGLGYYRRAQLLLKGSLTIMHDYHGIIPKSVSELLKVPGIGPYTAGAISSIAYNQCEPIVDGNVIRVLSRLYAIKLQVGNSIMDKLCWQLAKELVSSDLNDNSKYDKLPGEFNQALMELGATICKPTSPSCTLCPLKDICSAKQIIEYTKYINETKDQNNQQSIIISSKNQEITKEFDNKDHLDDVKLIDIEDIDLIALPKDISDFPFKLPKKKSKEIIVSVHVMRMEVNGNSKDDDRIDDDTYNNNNNNTDDDKKYKYLFVRRPNTGLLANQWEFPSIIIPQSGQDNIENEINPKEIIISLDKLWDPFPKYLKNNLKIHYIDNHSNYSHIKDEESSLDYCDNNHKMIIKSNSSLVLLDQPIIHIFSHQKHIMHVHTQDISLIYHNNNNINHDNNNHNNSDNIQWMSKEEIINQGITTGCKNVLNQITTFLSIKSENSKLINNNSSNNKRLHKDVIHSNHNLIEENKSLIEIIEYKNVFDKMKYASIKQNNKSKSIKKNRK